MMQRRAKRPENVATSENELIAESRSLRAESRAMRVLVQQRRTQLARQLAEYRARKEGAEVGLCMPEGPLASEAPLE